MVYFSAALGLVGLLVVAFLLAEWRGYAAGRGLLNRRLMITRALSALVLLILLGMVIWGTLRLEYSPQHKWMVFYYWLSVLIVLIVLLAFLLIDYRLMRERTEELKRELGEKFQRELQGLYEEAHRGKDNRETEAEMEGEAKDDSESS